MDLTPELTAVHAAQVELEDAIAICTTEHNELVVAHDTTLAALAAVQADYVVALGALAALQADYDALVATHAGTVAALASLQVAHAITLDALDDEQAAYAELQSELATLQSEHWATIVQLAALQARYNALTRDPLLWPYPSSSLWNMPIGKSAVLVPLGFKYGTGDNNTQNSRVTSAEENVLCLDPDAPPAYIKATNAGWDSTKTRCGSRTGGNLVGNGTVPPRTLPIPTQFTTDPYIGTTPNMSGALVYRDGADIKLFETQPLHLCSDGVAVSQFVNNTWVGDSIKTGGDGVKGGSHGGSSLTAFGGTIRLGELVPGGLIPHAVKVTMDTAWYCSALGGAGHRWPALKADSGWASVYGTKNVAVPNSAKMGMLLTLPASFDVETLVSEPARILARAVRDYGAYLCDGDANAATPWYTAWQVERSNRGSFTAEFRARWGFEFFHRTSLHGTAGAAQMAFRTDIGRMMEAVCIVNDNSPTNVGGAGYRRAPLAPPLT